MKDVPTSKAHLTAYRKGEAAYKEGKPRSACPYDYDDRCGINDHIITGARGYAKAWLNGWDNAKEASESEGK